MSKQVSPFASLTGAEKQIRWMEYQSVLLPYTHAELDVETEQEMKKPEAIPLPTEPKKENAILLPQERVQRQHELSKNDFQRTRHSQYDAIIARMRQAECRTSNYQSLS